MVVQGDGLNYTNPEAEYLTTFSGDQDDLELNKKVAQAEMIINGEIDVKTTYQGEEFNFNN